MTQKEFGNFSFKEKVASTWWNAKGGHQIIDNDET